MKNLLSVCLMALTMTLMTANVAEAQGLNYQGVKVEFTFPQDIEANKKTLFPTYGAVSAEYAATVAVEVGEFYTYLTLGSLTGNLTLNATMSSWLTEGALLYVETIATDQRTVTWGTGLDAPVFTTDSAKHELTTFIYNGTAFKKVATAKLD